MQLLSVSELKDLFDNQKEASISGRWIRYKDIEPLIFKHEKINKVTRIGYSEQKRAIYSIKIGSGKKKILIWSQMHGNESTGTKAIFDLLNTFNNTNEVWVKNILKECTIHIIPMLNPDGAEVFTRVNSDKIDLNRDAVTKIAIESKILRNFLDNFQPDFCFNLHDQRTIFGVDGSDKPATISFLAPSEDLTRSVTGGRKKTMNVIIAMNNLLQQFIPQGIGRYTDEFYPNATGDVFQKLGYSTILIEAGHYPNDYEREITRKYMFFSILEGVHHIVANDTFTDYKAYFNIPNNIDNFYDVLHSFKNSNEKYAYQYEELIINNKLVFNLKEITGEKIKNHISHNEIVFES
mgnify:CR=1 FL=1|tara:strand:- start:64 stop:1113 length:1050 start_codon:yes stop_codon:yes gene_type:complete